MIENTGIQTTSNPLSERAVLELKSVIRTLRFIEDKTNYDRPTKERLFTLQSRAQKQSSQTVQCGIQKGLTVSYLQRPNRLCRKQQRFSFEAITTYSIIYAKDTERNNQSHKELKQAVNRSHREGTQSTTNRNIKCYEGIQSGSICNNENRLKNRLSLELNLLLKTNFVKGINGTLKSSQYRALKVIINYEFIIEIIALKYEILNQRFRALKSSVNLTHLFSSHTDQHTQ